jgi:hypothetical protein
VENREFGAALLRTGDLDPVYIALVGAKLDPNLLARVCLAYWCFYSLGAACYIAENPKKFWERMRVAAANTDPLRRWPRAAERRHFRGQQAILAVENFASKGSPEKIVDHMCSGGTYHVVAKTAETYRGIGQWASWKIADMAERVLGYSVDFSDADLGIYKDPRQGLALIRTGDWKYPITDEELKDTVKKELRWIRQFSAPPMRDRSCGIAELETYACKLKSFRKGHYFVGKDIKEVRHALHGWGDVAQDVLHHVPECVNG